MKVRFLKGIASIFGTFESGMVIEVGNPKIAASWLRNGIAEEVKPAKTKPAKKPATKKKK